MKPGFIWKTIFVASLLNKTYYKSQNLIWFFVNVVRVFEKYKNDNPIIGYFSKSRIILVGMIFFWVRRLIFHKDMILPNETTKYPLSAQKLSTGGVRDFLFYR